MTKIDLVGAAQFCIAVKMDMAEFSQWEPERIKKFFEGLAKIVGAASGFARVEFQHTGKPIEKVEATFSAPPITPPEPTP